ncbi:MAG: DUF4837 family protein [Flammeovirgaceae bacterium]|nr:DUF4837 family protein [Flammeovirgaceae bacterium]
MKSRILPLITSFLILFACADKEGKNLPPSSGKTGDIFLIMDSTQWKGPLGDVLDSLFNAEMEGCPEKNQSFTFAGLTPQTELWIKAKKKPDLCSKSGSKQLVQV